MNLQSKKARVPIAALGVTALIAAAGALATPAFAAGITLAFGPTATAATIVDSTTTPGLSTGSSGLTYGTKVVGASGSDPTYVNVLTAPTGGSLYSQRVAANGAPTADSSFAGVTNAGVTAITISTTANSATGTLSAIPSTVGPSNYSLAGTLIKIGTGASAEYATVAAHTSGSTTVTLSAPAVTTQTTVGLMSAGAAASNNFYVPVAALASAPIPGYVAADNVYFGAVVPGDYTFRLFQDHNGNSSYDSAQDDATPTFTLHVKDVNNNLVAGVTTDDLDFGLTAPASSGIGQTVLATATMGGLTATDTRGGTTLAGMVAAATTFTFSGAAGSPHTGAPAYAASAYTRSSGTVTAAGTVTTVATLGSAGTSTVTTSVATNGVTGVTLAGMDVVGTVQVDGTTATQTNIKTGTAAATYTATVVNGVTAADIVGKTVYFTLAGTDAASLTTNGTTVDAVGHIYSATTNSSGVASLTVTDGATTPSGYTVAAQSNNISGVTRTAVYAAAAATTIAVTNTDAELTPTVAAGVSVTLKGKLTDQYSAPFQPALAGLQVVTVTVPANVTTICSAPITAGTFSCAYTPGTTPTAGTSTTFRFSYPAGASPLVNSAINWASTTAAASVTLTTPTDAATGVTLQDSTTPVATQVNAGSVPYGNTTGAVTGTVFDASSAPLAFKSVTLTGGSGVYFSTTGVPTSAAADDLVTSLTVVTNGSGQFSAFAYFTKSGVVKVTATSGTVKDEASVTTSDPTEPWKVTVNDAAGAPGSTLIVTGTVKDAFGDPVPGYSPDLSVGTSTLGALGDTTPTTNAAGVFSTTFVSGSNQSGTADLVASFGAGPNPTVNANWLANAGLTIPHGEFQDTATITLTQTMLTLSATGRLDGGGTAHLSGNYLPNTTVDIYAKPAGASSYSLIDSVQTDDQGDYGASYFTKRTVSFLAKSGAVSSPTKATVVFSTVTLRGKALGHGMVTLMGNGAPNAKTTLRFYRAVPGPDIKLGTRTSSSLGEGSITVKAPKGVRAFYVTYTAPGTSMGTGRLTIKIK